MFLLRCMPEAIWMHNVFLCVFLPSTIFVSSSRTLQLKETDKHTIVTVAFVWGALLETNSIFQKVHRDPLDTQLPVGDHRWRREAQVS